MDEEVLPSVQENHSPNKRSINEVALSGANDGNAAR